MVYIFILLAIIFIILVILKNLSFGEKNKWVSTEAFQYAKKKIRPYCSKEDFDDFMDFLNSYKGGYVRRRGGEIVHQDYLGNEKGDLKGIFYNIIVPNPKLSIKDKEQFRAFMLSIGVNGVNERPLYETRDSKLKNREMNEDDYQRKEVGNKGELVVRKILEGLESTEYSVINGPVLKIDEITKEFDHIVIGKNGLFVIETKAFGMTDGKASKASLFIDEGDKWILRKNGKNKELLSPSEQIMEEMNQLKRIISCPVEIHLVLVLSNSELFIKQNIDLPYSVIRIDKLKGFIENNNDIVSDNDRYTLLKDIDNSRIN